MQINNVNLPHTPQTRGIAFTVIGPLLILASGRPRRNAASPYRDSSFRAQRRNREATAILIYHNAKMLASVVRFVVRFPSGDTFPKIFKNRYRITLSFIFIHCFPIRPPRVAARERQTFAKWGTKLSVHTSWHHRSLRLTFMKASSTLDIKTGAIKTVDKSIGLFYRNKNCKSRVLSRNKQSTMDFFCK